MYPYNYVSEEVVELPFLGFSQTNELVVKKHVYKSVTARMRF